MSARRLGLPVLALWLLPAVSGADDHWADLMAAGSVSSGSIIGGGHVSTTFTLGCRYDAELGDCWSLVADGSYHGAFEPESRWTTGGGFRYDFPRSKSCQHLFFTQWLLTGARTNVSGVKNGWHGSWVVGAGVDLLRREPEYLMEGVSNIGARVQIDVVTPFGADKHSPYVRFSLGVILRSYKRGKQQRPNPPPPPSPSAARRGLTFPTTAP